jgi:hypothetical protein
METAPTVSAANILLLLHFCIHNPPNVQRTRRPEAASKGGQTSPTHAAPISTSLGMRTPSHEKRFNATRSELTLSGFCDTLASDRDNPCGHQAPFLISSPSNGISYGILNQFDHFEGASTWQNRSHFQKNRPFPENPYFHLDIEKRVCVKYISVIVIL